MKSYGNIVQNITVLDLENNSKEIIMFLLLTQTLVNIPHPSFSKGESHIDFRTKSAIMT